MFYFVVYIGLGWGLRRIHGRRIQGHRAHSFCGRCLVGPKRVDILHPLATSPQLSLRQISEAFVAASLVGVKPKGLLPNCFWSIHLCTWWDVYSNGKGIIDHHHQVGYISPGNVSTIPLTQMVPNQGNRASTWFIYYEQNDWTNRPMEKNNKYLPNKKWHIYVHHSLLYGYFGNFKYYDSIIPFGSGICRFTILTTIQSQPCFAVRPPQESHSFIKDGARGVGHFSRRLVWNLLPWLGRVEYKVQIMKFFALVWALK